MSSHHGPRTARLVVVGPAGLRGQEVILSGGDAVVGRGAGSQLILADPHVSRTHAVIRTTGNRTVVEDLGSSAGTKVNGVPTATATILQDGDVIAFAGVSVRYESAGSRPDETQISAPLPHHTSPPTQAGPARWPSPAPAAVRYDIGQQHAGVISNVGRDQYNAYVQQRESFLRDVAATKSKARVLAWLGFLLVVLGFTMYGASILRFMQQVQVANENTDPQDIQLLGPMGILGLGLFLLGSVLLIVGIVLHIVASARRRRVDRDMPPTFPRRPD
jgi:uncharacterized membrane protein YidH (DUF202 family)